MKKQNESKATRKPRASKSTAEVVINRECPSRQSDGTVETLMALNLSDPNSPPCDTFTHYKEGADACAACKAEHGARHEACVKATLGGNVKRRSKGGATASGKLGKYSNFAELRSQLLDPRGILNRKMDKATLEGATLAELLEIGKDGGKGMFKNLSMIKAHLKYRAAGGWVYSVQNGKITLVDYKPKTDNSKAVAEALKSAEATAAPAVATEEKKAA